MFLFFDLFHFCPKITRFVILFVFAPPPQLPIMDSPSTTLTGLIGPYTRAARDLHATAYHEQQYH